jgi:hypothetical protein
MKRACVVVKVGSSSLVGAGGGLDPKKLALVGQEVAAARRDAQQVSPRRGGTRSRSSWSHPARSRLVSVRSASSRAP